jgi:ComEC/Rec2-related protein
LKGNKLVGKDKPLKKGGFSLLARGEMKNNKGELESGKEIIDNNNGGIGDNNDRIGNDNGLIGNNKYIIEFYRGKIEHNEDEHKNIKDDIESKNIILNVYLPYNNENVRDSVALSEDRFSTKVKIPIERGDILFCNATISKITNYGNPYEFDYVQSMRNKGIKYSLYITKYFESGINIANMTYRYSDKLRERLIKLIDNVPLDKTQNSLALALIAGYRENLDEEVVSSLRENGLAHILAISGLHTGIVFLIIGIILYPLRLIVNNRLYYLLLIIAIWLYALVSGLCVSVCRASLMISLVLLGKMLYKGISMFNIVCCSAFVLLCINPYYLFDVCFQLSFSAVLSIMIFNPLFRRVMISNNILIDKALNILSMTLSAQVLTLPINIYYFNQLPLFFLVANMIVLPVLPFYIFTILVSAVLYAVGWGNDVALFISRFFSDVVVFGGNVEKLIGIEIANPQFYISSLMLFVLLSVFLLIALFFMKRKL